MASLVTVEAVEAARKALTGIVRMTPLEPSRPLSTTLRGPAWLKCENLQRAGSFKVRGAYLRISRLTPQERARGVRTRFVVRRGNTHHIVPAEQVDWMDVADNYLCLHAGPKTHLWRGTMKQAEEELDPERFVRIHRSTIVAVDRILTVKSHESGGHVVELRGGVQLRSSRQYADRVRALLR